MKTLITEDEIRIKIDSIGEKITNDYKDHKLTVLGVLTGSVVFLSDLIRHIDLPLRVDFIRVSSYRGEMEAGKLEIHDKMITDIEGRDILIVDDIYDTGNTLKALTEHIKEKNPASIKSVALLWKEGREMGPDYYCFKIPDVFVIGYGLDYNDEYRNLPFIAIPS